MRVTVLGLCVCVCVCVCLLLNISLFTWLFMPQTILTFSAADEGLLSDFFWKCFVAKLERFLLVRLHDKSAIFTLRKTRMRMNLDTWLAAILFLGETFFAGSIIAYWPLAASMPPTKVCQQCKAAVPVTRKTCERCDLVLWFKRKAECICKRKQFNYEMCGSSRIRECEISLES